MAKGLYRDASLPKQRIWWAIYHGDRFTSLLLGLPRGSNDVCHEAALDPAAPAEHQFVLRCALLAGRIIDRNVSKANSSFAKTVEMDEEMNAISSSMPPDWWNLPRQLPGNGPELDELRDRLLQQFYFFHVRIYLFLPFIKRSPITPGAGAREFAAVACKEPCREALRRFILLRADVEEGLSLFDCKTSDFVAFTAAVVLLCALSAPSPAQQDADRWRQDWDLISSAEDVFLRLERATGCAMAAQCRSALAAMRVASAGDRHDPVDISIPFFGKVTMSLPPAVPARAATLSQPATTAQPPSRSGPTESNLNSEAGIQALSLDALPIFDVGLEITEWLSSNVGDGDPLGHVDSWFDMDGAMIGLDEDWTAFPSAIYA